jgi:hypothetical protein
MEPLELNAKLVQTPSGKGTSTMVERKPLPTLCRQNQCHQSGNWVTNDLRDDPPLFSQVPQHYS